MRKLILFIFLAILPAQAAELGLIRDPHQILLVEQRQALGSILNEHLSLSDELVMLLISRDLNETELAKEESRFYKNSFEGDYDRFQNRMLVTIDYEAKKVRTKLSYSLSAIISPKELATEIETTIRNDYPATTAAAAVESVLKKLDSPLIESGKLQERLSSIQNIVPPKKEPGAPFPALALSLILGLGILVVSIFLMTGSEIHYSVEGIYQVHPFLQFVNDLRSGARGALIYLRTGKGETASHIGGVDGAW